MLSHPYPQAPNAVNIMREYQRHLGLPQVFKTGQSRSGFKPLAPNVDEKHGKFSPSQWFFMFTNHMGFYRKIAECTNKYAFKHKDLFVKVSKKTGKTTYKWKVISGVHIFLYVLVQIRMAICYRPTISLYWDEHHGDPVIKKLLSRPFYNMISQALCMYDPFMPKHKREKMSKNQTDNSYKCREMLEALNFTCVYFHYIGAHLSLDESIVPMHNRTTLSQKFRNKVITKGARFFKIENPLGYVFLNILDCQHTRNEYEKFADVQRKGSKIVLYCLETLGILKKHRRVAFAHVIYMDTYYMSIPLTHYLLKQYNGIYLNGTLRGNAVGKPLNYDTIDGKKMVKGDLQLWTDPDQELFLASWFDTKLFQHVTSVPHNPDDFVSKVVNKDVDIELRAKIETSLTHKFEEYNLKTKAQLQTLCVQRAIPKHGRKPDLIDRLLDYDFFLSLTGEVVASNTNVQDDNKLSKSNDSINVNKSNNNLADQQKSSSSNDNSNAVNKKQKNNNDNDNTIAEQKNENENETDYMTQKTTEPEDINAMYKRELIAQVNMREIQISKTQCRRMKVDELRQAIRSFDGTENIQTNKKTKRSVKKPKKPQKPVQIPKQIHEYRKNMIGVDQHDRLVLTMSVGRKTVKWTLKMIFHIIDVAIANTKILHNITTCNDVSLAEVAHNQASRNRTMPHSSRHFERCPKNKQMPKHLFMRHIVYESIPAVRQLLKNTHKHSRNKFTKLWNQMSNAEKRGKQEYLYWVRHMDDKDVRLTRETLPEELRTTPDKRKSKSVSKSVSKTTH